jgi:putative copper export protein
VFGATDAVVVGLRALVFVALFQATGTALFAYLFGGRLSAELAARARRFARVAALVALGLTITYLVLSPARLAGSFDGALDPSLQSLMLESSAGLANIVRIVGLALLAMSLGSRTRLNALLGLAGTGLALGSFLLMGHTTVLASRWLLAPLLFVHLAVAAAWFGALIPLGWIVRDEPAPTSGAFVARFSALAARTVPLIFVCGAVMAAIFVGSLAGLLTAYGAMVIVKTVGFAVLMALAALNKWRYGPAIAAHREGAAGSFVRTIAVEAVLIAAILMTTGVMTSLFAPAHLHASSSHPHADHG